MKEMNDIRDFENALMKKLALPDDDKVFLKNVSATIANLKKNGLVIDQILVKGRPRVDRYIINGLVDPDFWGRFKDLGSVFRRFEVFPYGIVHPEGFRFKALI